MPTFNFLQGLQKKLYLSGQNEIFYFKLIWLILWFLFCIISVTYPSGFFVASCILLGVFLLFFRKSDSNDQVLLSMSALSIWMIFRHLFESSVTTLNPRTLVYYWVPVFCLIAPLFSSLQKQWSARLILPILPIYCWYFDVNINAQSWDCLGLLLFAFMGKPVISSVALLGASFFALFYWTCHSAIVSGMAAFFYLLKKNLSFAFFGACLGLVVSIFADKLIGDAPVTGEFFHFRDYLAYKALDGFLHSPLYGTAWGAVWQVTEGARTGAIMPYAHCLPLTILAEGGIIGFALACWIVAAIWRRLPLLNITGQTLVIMFAVWSFFDEPTHNADGMTMFLLALYSYKEDLVPHKN